MEVVIFNLVYGIALCSVTYIEVEGDFCRRGDTWC